MAERRMFSKSLIDSDAFVDMTTEARLLYYDLSMRADDDGFVNSPKKIMRMLGASQQSLDELTDNGFIIAFDSGVVVITHWNINNRLRKDRYKPTLYQDEKSMLGTDESGSYILCANSATKAQPDGNRKVPNVDTQFSIGKVSIGKQSAQETDLPCGSHTPTKPYGEFNNVMLSDEELSKLKSDVPDYDRYIEELSNYIARTGKRYKSHYATIKAWYRREARNGIQGHCASSERAGTGDYDADILEVLKNA